MNKNETIVGIAVIGAITIATVDYFKTKRQHQKIRADIKANTAAEISAIQLALKIVEKKIKDGDYDRTGIPGVFNDLKFYRIAARFEEE